MNLRELQYLIALADHCNFGRAAEVCLVSQPTLSTQIRKLEEELGVTLVERTPRNIMLTPAGLDAVERARRIMDEIDQMKESARRRRETAAGTVRLGVFPTLGPYLLPSVVRSLQTALPQLELLLVEEKSPLLLEQLRSGKLDAAILALPVNDAQLDHEFLFEEPFLLAVPNRHRLAKRQSLSQDDLAGLDLMLLEDGHCLRDQALDICRLTGSQEEGRFRATSLETMRQMVMAGSGITLLPALATIGKHASPEDLHLLPFDVPAPGRRIGLFWRRRSAMDDLLKTVADVIRRTALQLLARD